jgi:hypothetical protein
MEQSEDGQETHAIATRELLFMQLLVLLRRSSLVEGLEDNERAPEPSDGLAGRSFCRGCLLGNAGG